MANVYNYELRMDRIDKLCSFLRKSRFFVFAVLVLFGSSVKSISKRDFYRRLVHKSGIEEPTDNVDSVMKKLKLKHSKRTKNCVASWYGDYFHGRQTANQEIYDKNKLTAAHKSLPFNTYLLVTNKKTNKKVVVRVNDRGPYITGREVDLSEAAATALGGRDDGVMNITYEILERSQVS